MAHPFRLMIILVAAVMFVAGGVLMMAQPAFAQNTPVQAEPAKPRLQAQRPRVQAPAVQVRPALAEEGDEAAAGTDCFSGLLNSLRIGADGEIGEITLSSRSTNAMPRIRGCGARIADLPFLWDLYRDKDLIVEYCYRDGCLSAINLIY